MSYTRNATLISKKYFEFFWPTLLMVFANTIAITVDAIIVSRMLGATSMSAVNACMPLSQIYATLGAWIGLGAASTIAVMRGKGVSGQNQIYTVMWSMLILVGVALMVVQFVFRAPISTLLNTDPVIQELAYDYIGNLTFAILPMIVVMGISNIIQLDCDPKLSAAMVIAANVVNLVSDIIFMGPCKMGIAGSSLATVVGYVVGLSFLIVYARSEKRTLKLLRKWELAALWQIIKNGFAAAVTYALVAVQLLLMNRLVTQTGGKEGLLTYSLSMSVYTIQSIVSMGVVQAMMPIIGIYYGERDYNGIRLLLRRGFLVLAVMMGGAAVCILAFPQLICSLYAVYEPTQATLLGIRLFTLSVIPGSVNVVMIYYYTAIQNRKMSLMITVCRGLLAVVPCCYLGAYLFGMTGVFAGFIVANILTLALVLLPGGQEGFSVLKLSEEPVLLELSLKEDNIHDVLDQVLGFLKDQGIDEKYAIKLGIAIEEYYQNTKKNNQKPAHVDIVIKKYESLFVVSMVDDGIAFNPLLEENRNDNIHMLRAISTKLEYQYVIGLNRVQCSLIRS